MQSESALYSALESVTRNILDSLCILFGINFWLLDVEKNVTIDNIFRTGTFSYMTLHGAVATSLGNCALRDFFLEHNPTGIL